VLTGPRQSGKTTLLLHLFGSRYRHVDLGLPDLRLAAAEDPRAFLELYPPPVIFDEIQHVPELLPYIREKIDRRRAQPGQFLLSGSQNLLLMAGITESLAGRAAVLRLLPLARREQEGRPRLPLPWESRRRVATKKLLAYRRLWQMLIRGSYPELTAHPRRDAALWHASYIQTYLERDVRALRNVGDLSQFQVFLRALAARSAQLLNLTELARDLGLAVNTVKAWLAVLEASHQIIVLRPYFANIGKRLVKTPKVYFTDVGTLCHLVGLREPDHAANGPMAGAIFETAVLAEIVKSHLHRGLEPQVYFWRTAAGTEVDFIVEWHGRLVPIEAKTSATPRPAMASAIRTFQTDFGEKAATGFLIHPGHLRLPLADRVLALPFGEL